MERLEKSCFRFGTAGGVGGVVCVVLCKLNRGTKGSGRTPYIHVKCHKKEGPKTPILIYTVYSFPRARRKGEYIGNITQGVFEVRFFVAYLTQQT